MLVLKPKKPGPEANRFLRDFEFKASSRLACVCFADNAKPSVAPVVAYPRGSPLAGSARTSLRLAMPPGISRETL